MKNPLWMVFLRKIIDKWSFFQQAMFDFQRVQNLKTAISKRKKIVPCSSEGGVPRQGRDSWGTFQLESGSLLKKHGVEREKWRFAAWKWDLRMKNWVYMIEASKINSWAKAYEKKTTGKRLFATEKHHLSVSVPTRSLYSNYPLVSTLY